MESEVGVRKNQHAVTSASGASVLPALHTGQGACLLWCWARLTLDEGACCTHAVVGLPPIPGNHTDSAHALQACQERVQGCISLLAVRQVVFGMVLRAACG